MEIMNQSLEAVENVIREAKNQWNKGDLLRIKEIIQEFKNDNYEDLSELRDIMLVGYREGSGPESDIRDMSVNVDGKSKIFGNVMSNLMSYIERQE